MQEDVTFKVKVESGGFMATQIAVKSKPTAVETPLGISGERLSRFKKSFEAKWMKEQLAKAQNQKMEDSHA
jgi:hypothetical protein